MNRHALRAMPVLVTALLLASLSAGLADSYVTILHFNDFHGYLQPVEKDGKSIGGLSRIASAVQAGRRWNDAHGNLTLLLEAGDILQGTPMSMTYKGEPDVLCLNHMRVDAMCIGNHEFDFGQANLSRLTQLARFPILSVNVYVAETGRRLAPPAMEFTLPDGTPAVAFGLTTETVAVETMPVNVEGLSFTNPTEECRRLLDEYAGRAQFFVALTHIGYEEDLKLAKACPELDVIIGGHSHTVVRTPTRVGRTLVCQTGSYGRFLGHLDMLVRKGDVAKYRGFLQAVDDRLAQEPVTKALIQSYAVKLDQKLQEVVAQAAVDLDGERDVVRSQETNLGDLVADCYREYTRADVCLVNAGGIRASVPAGPITVGDVLKVAPFSNLLATKPVSGAQLREALEFAASRERPHGGFLQVSGLTMVIEGNHLAEVKVAGQPLDDEKTYLLAAPEFLLAGGDGYAMLKQGAPTTSLGFADNAILIEMLRQQQTVSPQVDGRIVVR